MVYFPNVFRIDSDILNHTLVRLVARGIRKVGQKGPFSPTLPSPRDKANYRLTRPMRASPKCPHTPHFPNHLNINPNQKRIFTFSLVLSKKFRNLQFFKMSI